MAGGGKDKLEYIKQDTPKFLRDFKAKANFKDGPTVDTKRQKTDCKNSGSDDERDEREDEKPVICVLKEGDLTKEEYERLKSSEKDQEIQNEGKVMFKKPEKRNCEGSSNDLNASSSVKKQKSDNHRGKQLKQGKKLDNKKLLSFDDEDL